MKEFIYINGALVLREEARISPLDRGILYGYGLFETMRSYGGHVFSLDRHLARLMHSAGKIGLNAGLDPDAIGQAIYKTLEANECPDARIRLTVLAGEGERGLTLPTPGALTIIIVAERLVLPPPRAYKEGLCAVVASTRRNSRSLLAGIKSINYLDNLVAQSEAVTAGADQAILLNELGFVAECSTSNIFMVVGGQLLTPSVESGILPGVTREKVIELALNLGVAVVEEEISLAVLLRADEAFMTNSIIEVMPVTAVDGKPVGSGMVGEITEKLMGAYGELVLQQGNHC